jgi:hypothetical protein
MATAAVINDGLDLQASDLTEQDRLILAQVDSSLADGLALKRWWERTDAANGYARRFDLIRTFNSPDTSFGFFDQTPVGKQAVPVMGIVETMLYDRPKQAAPAKVRDELREFILHYFMRISAFEQPEAYAESNFSRLPPLLANLSWCPQYEARKRGFGYSQLYYKRRASGRIGKFLQEEEFAIVDLRDIGAKYEWIVTKVRIYDFSFTIRPRGQESVQLVIPLKEESYLVLSPGFIVNEDDPSPQVLGRYGFGYAFIKDPSPTGLLAYGPGRFNVSFQLINFRVLRSGAIETDLIFAANQPEQVLNVTIAPIDWSIGMANVMSLGMASRLLAPLRPILDRLPVRVNGFDPVTTSVDLVNLLTGGLATQELCISREQLAKDFLVQHFMQHYQMVTSSLLTWRQYPNWLDPTTLPEWIIKGVSS